MTIALIALGSNLGERRDTIQQALTLMRSIGGLAVRKVSSLIETEPVGSIAQGDYLNGVCLVESDLGARQLLAELLEIEIKLGRCRENEQRWGPRTIDLDLLVFGDEIIDEPGLCVPHPRLAERLFVLEPLTEIVPELLVPGGRLTVGQLYENLRCSGDQPCS